MFAYFYNKIWTDMDVSFLQLIFTLTFITQILELLLLIIGVLIGVAYFTLLERKLISAIQRRLGPNVVGAYGLLQPLADGLKFLIKETITPTHAHGILFIIAPAISFILSIIMWVVLPVGYNVVLVDPDLGLLFCFCIGALAVYGIILAGWSSNSKYSFLGGLRSTAQMISYEITIGFVYLCVIVFTQSLNISEIVYVQSATIWFCIPLCFLAVIYFILILAETNRHPFDLPEAEAELVAGYNVEYSGMIFALFFLGEYSNMLSMSSMAVILFFGGWLSPFGGYVGVFTGCFWFMLKLAVMLFLFIIARAAFPRYRYDQLMSLGWKIFLPLTAGFFVLEVLVLTSLGCFSV